jgi:hypothetical protein
MSLIRFIIYSIIAYFVLRLISWLLGEGSKKRVAQGRFARGAPQRERSSPMVRCDSCGTFITAGSALLDGRGQFCSAACAEARKVSRT